MGRGAEPTVVHAYGVVLADSRLDLSASGIDDAAVRLATYHGLAVLFSELAESRYGPGAWQQHGQDPTWLSAVAQQHHAVLGAVVAQGDVVPLRLPGIYADEAALAAAVSEEAGAFLAALDAIHDQVEWGVKVFRMAEPEVEPTEAPTSGRDYLRRKSDAAAAKEQAWQRTSGVLDGIHQALVTASSRGVLNRPQDAALSGRAEPMLLNGAYLVKRSRADRFLTVVAALDESSRRHGLAVEVSGPWPPYNFTGVIA